MKKIILSLTVLLTATSLYAQMYKPGIVKGENVTYEVVERDSFLFIKNLQNPDTTFRDAYYILGTLEAGDIWLRVAEIIAEHLRREELLELKNSEDGSTLWIKLRIDTITFTIKQVSEFHFGIKYGGKFWSKISPERLHEIENDIIKRVKVSKNIDSPYKKKDFCFPVSATYIIDGKFRKWLRKEFMKDSRAIPSSRSGKTFKH